MDHKTASTTLPKGTRMTRTLLALILALNAVGASALDWPWQEPALGKTPEYCKGFVVGGLASKQVAGTSRTALWLAWSYGIRSGFLHQNESTNEFQAGLDQLQNAPDPATAESILQQSDGYCGLGRTGCQITGW